MTQQEYIAILFDDTGVNTAAKRKAWLTKRMLPTETDKLSKQQASSVITQLKQTKDNMRAARQITNDVFDDAEDEGYIDRFHSGWDDFCE